MQEFFSKRFLDRILFWAYILKLQDGLIRSPFVIHFFRLSENCGKANVTDLISLLLRPFKTSLLLL